MNTNHNSMCRLGNKVLINDITLRDGNQSAYGTLYSHEKIRIARKLEKMGIDIIEAGFSSSNGDGENIERIAEIIKKPYISGLARCNISDIDKTYVALRNYTKRMLHIFIATSKIHVETKLKKTFEQVIQIANESIKYGKQYFEKIEFSAEDATRSDIGFLREIFSEAISAGATTINIPDSVGCVYPTNFGKIVEEISTYLRQIKPNIVISVHCHNDRGLALANTLEGIKNGANQAEVSVNGLGERAGNCSLEQVVANGMLEDSFYYTDIDSRQLYSTSRMVARATGVKSDMAPIVGKTAFAHKSGIHQDGVIKNRKNYEVFDPLDFARESEIIIGPHSGYHGMIAKARELGRTIDEAFARKALEIVSERVRARKEKRFDNKDLIEIFSQVDNIVSVA